jgi:hypothetical protein
VNVNGVLVGRVVGGADGNAVEVTDAIPMLHTSVAVTPNVEIAMEAAGTR